MKRLLIFLAILIVVFTTGCGDTTTKDVGQFEKPVNEENELTTETSENKYTAPLTGLPTEEEVTNRIIGVMINNHSKARPQSGLLKADMVYEILAEGPITRLVAIYHSNEAEIIGPVRSIRPYYLELINGFDAYIVHAGSSQEALATIQKNDLPDIDEIENASVAFWRADNREAPHNLYTSTDKITSFAEKRNYRSEGYIPELKFLNEDVEVTGTPAENVTINYYSDYAVSYQYDETTKLYKRFINGKPHIDFETKEQLTAKNLLVIRADHQIIDDVGRRKIDIYGPDKGYLFQHGIVRDVEWERKDGVIRAFINGEEQGLYPGQTWTIVVEKGTKVFYN